MSNLTVKPSVNLAQAQAPAAAPKAPETKPQVQTASTLSSGDELQTYTVKKGDTLWAISGAKLSDPTQWPAIHKLNKDQIKNPDLIYPNQVIKLPILKEKPAPAEPAKPAEPAQPAQPAEPAKPAEPPVNTAPPAPPAPPVLKPAPERPAQPVQTEKPKSRLISDIGKAAAIGGVVGAVGTAGTLAAITATLAPPLSNLGGYGTAQVVAKKIASLGVSVPQGPALSKLVSQVGGPKMATAGVAIGVGIAAAGLAAGGYYLYQKATQD